MHLLYYLTCTLVSSVDGGDSNTLSSDGEVLSSFSCSRKDGKVSVSEPNCDGRGPATSSTGLLLRARYLLKY